MGMVQATAVKHHSPEQVAATLGVSVRIIRRQIKDGGLLAVRIGRLLRISDASLRAFLAERTIA